MVKSQVCSRGGAALCEVLVLSQRYHFHDEFDTDHFSILDCYCFSTLLLSDTKDCDQELESIDFIHSSFHQLPSMIPLNIDSAMCRETDWGGGKSHWHSVATPCG